MGIFGTKKETPPPHPRQEPRYSGPLTADGVAGVFDKCADFNRRTLYLNNDPDKQVEMLFIAGQVRNERACDYVLRPLTQNEALREADDMDAAFDLMLKGGLYSLVVQSRDTMDQVVFDLIDGSVALLFPGKEQVLTLSAGTEEKRSVSNPENEPDVKGARDSFVESLRTNTSLVRRRFRAPELKIEEQIVGRQSVTPVDVLYVDGIADPDLAAQVKAKVEQIDIDALLMTGSLEQYVADESQTAFPLTAYTERPDRFCTGLAEGRVGVIVDGIPMGWLFPATLDSFFRTGQDRSTSWVVAGALSVLRYICMLITLFLPGLYVAAVLFYPELIPVKLTLSIIAAKADVPFSTLTEVLVMLLAFEVLQEAGLRLPSSIGQTVSILGGLVVGSAAVEAKLVSPAVLVVVAIAGIAGYTAPSQDFAGALRIWRFVTTVAGGLLGLTGLVLAGIALVYRLAKLETFGIAYLTPFASNAGKQKEGHTVLREPLPEVKTRPDYLNTENRRNQGVRKWLLVCIGLAVLLAGWRPAPREPEGLALVRVLGVDGHGPVLLTAVCGGEDQEGDQSRGQCAGTDFEEALEGLPWSGKEELSLTSVSYLIVGRDVDLENVLLTALRNEELGASASVWLAETRAADLLEGCEDPATRLELLVRQGMEAPTVVEALAALYGGGELCLPLLTAEENGLMLVDWEEWRESA